MPCSVIIIAYNSRDFIPACLASVREALTGLDSEIIVLDNGSPFPLTQDVKDMFPEVVWLNSKENLGFGRGCNLAATHATKPYLFFINPDTIISKTAFSKTLEYIQQNPKAGLVGCRILNEDGSLQWACRRAFPSPLAAIFKTIGLASLFPKSRFFASYNMTYLDPDQETEVDAISGSFFCISDELYKTLGGFDESFFMYGEDLDLCFRAKKLGYNNYYFPETNIIHFRGQSSKTRRFRSYLDFYNAMIIFNRKHKQFNIPLFLVSLGIFFASLVGIFSKLVPQFWKMIFDIGIVFALAGTVSLDFALLLAFSIWFPLLCLGEYSSPELDASHHLKFLFPILVLVSLFAHFSLKEPPAFIASVFFALGGVLFWRRLWFWGLYFFRIFTKKRHRSIIVGGSLDSLHRWFNQYDLIPGIEILGCVSEIPEQITDENRMHLLGHISELKSICQRTGCRELLIYSNRSGFRELLNDSILKDLPLKLFLLVDSEKKGDFALVNLKYLD
jgi:GT2 family glycosyltransferase